MKYDIANQNNSVKQVIGSGEKEVTMESDEKFPDRFLKQQFFSTFFSHTFGLCFKIYVQVIYFELFHWILLGKLYMPTCPTINLQGFPTRDP